MQLKIHELRVVFQTETGAKHMVCAGGKMLEKRPVGDVLDLMRERVRTTIQNA